MYSWREQSEPEKPSRQEHVSMTHFPRAEHHLAHAAVACRGALKPSPSSSHTPSAPHPPRLLPGLCVVPPICIIAVAAPATALRRLSSLALIAGQLSLLRDCSAALDRRGGSYSCHGSDGQVAGSTHAASPQRLHYQLPPPLRPPPPRILSVWTQGGSSSVASRSRVPEHHPSARVHAVFSAERRSFTLTVSRVSTRGQGSTVRDVGARGIVMGHVGRVLRGGAGHGQRAQPPVRHR